MNANNRKRILVFGCGWLGKKLGQHLISDGYTVYGTTRSKEKARELEAIGIQSVVLDLSSDELEQKELPEVDAIVISISPGRREGRTDYPHIISRIGDFYAQRGAQIVMYSSTSAYGNLKGEVNEERVPDDENNVLVSAEEALKSHIPTAVILRLCGLYGEDRHPVRSLTGRKDIPNGDAPVNLVHSDDVIQVTQAIIEQGITSDTFNVCSDVHPTRSELYQNLADKRGLEKPEFLAGGEDGKVIVSKKVEDDLGLSWIHSSLFE